MFYTYVWKDAAEVPFYVGKGGNDSGKRSRNLSSRSAEFKAVHAIGGCTVEIVDEFILESQAHAHEMELIALYGRREFGGLLVNRTDGGEGNCGAVFSEEHKAKIAAGRRGKRHTPEVKMALSAAKLGARHTPEAIEKIRRASTGRKHGPEAIAKISAIHKGKSISAEMRKRISNSLSGRRLPEAHVENMRAAVLARYQDPAEKVRSARSAHLSPPRKDNTSGFKGVSFSNERGKWAASIKIDGKHVKLGRHITADEAARAYDAAAVAAYGFGSCYLNFPDDHKPALAA